MRTSKITYDNSFINYGDVTDVTAVYVTELPNNRH